MVPEYGAHREGKLVRAGADTRLTGMTKLSAHPARPVTKAVIPAAGLGTIPPGDQGDAKEMLPIVDKPAISMSSRPPPRAR